MLLSLSLIECKYLINSREKSILLICYNRKMYDNYLTYGKRVDMVNIFW